MAKMQNCVLKKQNIVKFLKLALLLILAFIHYIRFLVLKKTRVHSELFGASAIMLYGGGDANHIITLVTYYHRVY